MEGLVSPSEWNQTVTVAVPLLGLLLAGNLYFIMRLVNRVQKLDETVTGTFPVYNNRLQAAEGGLAKLADDLKAVDGLRERVAVLEYAVKAGRVVIS